MQQENQLVYRAKLWLDMRPPWFYELLTTAVWFVSLGAAFLFTFFWAGFKVLTLYSEFREYLQQVPGQ